MRFGFPFGSFSFGFKTSVAVCATILGTGCGGGGCSSGCGGSSVIPGGFPKDQRVQNAGGVRVTRAGLTFLENNLNEIIPKILAGGGAGAIKDGILTFPISEASGTGYKICEGGPRPDDSPPKCIVEIKVTGLKDVKMTAINPRNLTISAKLPIRLRNLPIKGLGFITGTACLGTGARSPSTIDFLELPITADIALEEIDGVKYPARAGYTRIYFDPAKIAFDKKKLEDNFNFCGGGLGDSVLNLIKPLVVGSVTGGITGTLGGPLNNATCMKSQKLDDGTEQCPTGTFNRSGTCRYADKDDAECVPMLLGIESRFDLSGLLASISPGTTGGLDFMLASSGNMSPAPGTAPATNGMTLSMFGGAIPQPISNCVTPVDMTLPTGLTLPDELSANDITPWPAAPADKPHIGFGLAEKYLNHAFKGAYNSGLLCIGVSTEQVAQLNGGLFSIVLKSIPQLADTFLTGATKPSLALSIRPQKPPVVTIGDGSADFKSPTLDVNLKDADLDFYMWSHERFVRIFTGRIDLRVPVNLEAGKDGLGIKFPAKEPISITNARVSNNTLLLESDTQISNFLAGLGGLIPASTFAGIKPINLDSALSSVGLKLVIPKEGIRKIAKGGENFLGIFASLAVSTTALPQTKVARASITKRVVDPKNFELATAGTLPPEFHVHVEATEDDGSHDVEYAVKVDQGVWSTYEKGRDLIVKSPFFLLQGKHTISVQSRLVGVPETESEAVKIPLILDVMAPMVRIQNVKPGEVKILAADFVSDPEVLDVEARIDGGAWTAVKFESGVSRTLLVPLEAAGLEVRAKDESGNIGTTSSALIRGRSDQSIPKSASGCGCELPGGNGSSSSSSGLMMTFGALAVLGAVFERRRRTQAMAKHAAFAGLVVTSLGTAGCNCAGGSDDNNVTGDTGPETTDDTGPKSPVRSYVIGSFMSAAATSDGSKVWVAGYNEGDPVNTSDGFQGDLAVGIYDKTAGKVKWEIVDGVPSVDPTGDPAGFRKGITEPGDDVGLYTALVVNKAGNPSVAYFDRTNRALKFASYDGTKWTIHVVDLQAKGYAGKFNQMILVGDKPVIAYQSVELATGGYLKAKVRVARATSESPASTSDWSLEDVASDEKTACIAGLCPSGQKCIAGADQVCAETTTGCTGCSDTCVKGPKDGKPLCAVPKEDVGGYVNAIGASIGLAKTPTDDLAVVFYDRFHGNLRAATNKGGKWTVTPTTAPLDGYVGDVAKNKALGDRGLGSAIAVDSTGNWHVTYIDGNKESLLYKFLPGGDFSKPAANVTVDDGASVDGTTKFTDGLHLVGETPHISVDGTSVKIVYQDSTAGTLRWAKTTAGPAAKFTRGALKSDGTSGFFPRVIGGDVFEFYRMKGKTLLDDGTEADPVILGDVRARALP